MIPGNIAVVPGVYLSGIKMSSDSNEPDCTRRADLPRAVLLTDFQHYRSSQPHVLSTDLTKHEDSCAMLELRGVLSSKFLCRNCADMTPTNDRIIRTALKAALATVHAHDERFRIVEEFGLEHGAIRADIAVVNGFLHGYEIKSDRDTLLRLPEQMGAYNSVFDRVTLVVGKQHLHDAIMIVPDWWGIIVAKIGSDHSVLLNPIREAGDNDDQSSVSIARLLWRNEALRILEEVGAADGLRSKPRESIYQRLSVVLGQATLGTKVREALFVRADWRSGAPLVLHGG